MFVGWEVTLCYPVLCVTVCSCRVGSFEELHTFTFNLQLFNYVTAELCTVALLVVLPNYLPYS